MGQQIIQQPDGKFAVFSSISDSLIITDATQEEIVEWRAEEAANMARERTLLEFERVLDPGNPRPYRQFTLTWDEAVAREAEDDGDEE
jgi:hypothetical protein